MKTYIIIASLAVMLTHNSQAQIKINTTSFNPFAKESFIETSILAKTKAFEGGKLDKILYGVELYLENAESIARQDPQRIARMGIVDFQDQLFNSLRLENNPFYTTVLNAIDLLKNNKVEIRKHTQLKNACRWGYIAWVDVMEIQKEKKDILNICVGNVIASKISLETGIESILHELLHLSGVKSEGNTKRVESIIVILAGELPFITYVRNNEYLPFLDSFMTPVTQDCLLLSNTDDVKRCLLYESITKWDYSKLIGLENKNPDNILYHRIREAVLFDDIELAKDILPNNKELLLKITQYIDPKGKTIMNYASSKKMKHILDGLL